MGSYGGTGTSCAIGEGSCHCLWDTVGISRNEPMIPAKSSAWRKKHGYLNFFPVQGINWGLVKYIVTQPSMEYSEVGKDNEVDEFVLMWKDLKVY